MANSTKVGIINYGMGNLGSVANAFASLDVAVEILSNPADLQSCTHILLPGVGAFGDGIANLNQMGWIPAMQQEVVLKKKFFLGICLGMQLLASEGFEHGQHQGLNWIKGKAVKLEPQDPKCKIPHIGWNDAIIKKRDGLFKNLTDPCVFYFVHSYVLVPDDTNIISSVTHHGSEFVSSVEQENIWAAQFHPEKSQKCGLQLLRNFAQRGMANA